MIGLNPNFRLERRVPVMNRLTKDGGGCVEAGFWVEAVESWVEAIDGWLETVGSWLEAKTPDLNLVPKLRNVKYI